MRLMLILECDVNNPSILRDVPIFHIKVNCSIVINYQAFYNNAHAYQIKYKSSQDNTHLSA